jgi:hypothetical protein
MADDRLPDDLRDLWRDLDKNSVPLSLEDVRKEAMKLQKTLRRRSLLGGGSALLVIAGFSFTFFAFPNVPQRIGSALIVLAAVYVIIQVRMRRGTDIPAAGTTKSVQFLRLEFERQRDFHQGIWFWSRSMILLVGLVIFFVGFAAAYPAWALFIWLELAAALFLAGLAVPLNLRSARRYQRKIDALNALESGS